VLEPTVEATVVQQATNHLLPQLKFLEKHLRLLWKTVDVMMMSLVAHLQGPKLHLATRLVLWLETPT
jgi:hypothetical protein